MLAARSAQHSPPITSTLVKPRRLNGRTRWHAGLLSRPRVLPSGDREAARRGSGREVHQSSTSRSFTKRTCDALEAGHAVGWFQGRMEFGPRALGARSILGDPRNPEMQKTLNLKIKYRESFRPFAPSVLREDVADYFELDADSPYMLLVADVKRNRRRRHDRRARAAVRY